MWITSVFSDLINGRAWSAGKSWTLPAFNTNVQNITVTRQRRTVDGLIGNLSCDYTTFKCATLENLADAVRPGRYKVIFDMSPRLKYVTPHLLVPDRDTAAGGDAGIRVHKANYPGQLEGCIALGTAADGDAVDNSKAAFDEFMLLTDKAKETWLEIRENFSVG